MAIDWFGVCILIRYAKGGVYAFLRMVSAVAVVGLLIIIIIHTLVSAVLSRFFRIHLDSRIGAAVFTVLFVPLVLVVSLIVLSGALGLGGVGFTDHNVAITLTILLPFMLGYSIDYLWMPSPAEVERARRTELEKRP